VACLTYGNDGADEFSTRLRKLGINAGPRLVTGTVHSFCRNQVLRPYAALVGERPLAQAGVLTNARRTELLRCKLRGRGIHTAPSKMTSTVYDIRFALANGATLNKFSQSAVRAVQDFEEAMATEEVIDSDGMVFSALRIIVNSATVRDLLVSRFPWLAIDEYQDLGGPLNCIVLALREAAAHIFAVGDPDQCIYGFLGADPRHLIDLAALPGVTKVPLVFNYRSGGRLIAAAHAGLGKTRNYVPRPGRETDGEIFIVEKDPGLDAQVEHIIDELVPQLLDDGTEPHEIAILYKQSGPVLDALTDRINASDIKFAIEKDDRFPASYIITWLRRCAAKATGTPEALPLGELEGIYRGLLPEPTGPSDWLDIRVQLAQALTNVDVDEHLSDWIAKFDGATGVRELLLGKGENQQVVDFDELSSAELADITVGQLGEGTQVKGRVVVTTCHSSKGRQFESSSSRPCSTACFRSASTGTTCTRPRRRWLRTGARSMLRSAAPATRCTWSIHPSIFSRTAASLSAGPGSSTRFRHDWSRRVPARLK
jgi:DNA helicase-2/ATP-dependent DNA helicase PcrA